MQKTNLLKHLSKKLDIPYLKIKNMMINSDEYKKIMQELENISRAEDDQNVN